MDSNTEEKDKWNLNLNQNSRKNPQVMTKYGAHLQLSSMQRCVSLNFCLEEKVA